MKKLLFALAIFCAAGEAKSQSLKIGGGLNIGIPVKDLNGSSIGVGADLLAALMVGSGIGITGDVGYTALFAKSGGSTTNIIPLRAGVRIFASPNFYLTGKIGAGFVSNDGSSITTTAYSLGGGYAISNKMDLGVTYDAYAKNGTIGLLNLRLGFFF